MSVSERSEVEFEAGGEQRFALPFGLAGFDSVYRASNDPPFEDALLLELADSAPVRRLRDIGFLGAVDYMRRSADSGSRWRPYSRYDHSVGVAKLALLYAGIRALPQRETRVLATAGLLHDVGHGPLSHSLEPIFKQCFGVSHHETGSDIVRGTSRFGAEVPRIVSRYGIDPDEIQDTVEGRLPGAHGFLFSSPINLDTIEGISRCRSFFAPGGRSLSAARIVSAIAMSDTLPTQIFDDFWRSKHDMYSKFIHKSCVILCDSLAKLYMLHNMHSFQLCDFYKSESALRNKHRELFGMLDWIGWSPHEAKLGLSAGILDRDIEMQRRSFFIESSIALDGPAKTLRRYRQSKTSYTLTLRDLLTAREIEQWH